MGKVYNFNKEEINDMIKMYQNLEPIYKIAEKYGVDFSVIKKRLEENDIIVSKSSPYSIKHWMDRGLTENEAKRHIKTLRPVNKEYWLKLGYSEDEAFLQIEGQKLVSLRGCIARFGEKEGSKIWAEREDKRSKCGKKGNAGLEYWLNKGYSLEEAKKERRKRQQTFSREICIKKYGEKKGLKIFIERQNKWQETLYRNGKLKSGYSEISQELFFKLLKFYSIKDSNLINFAKKGGEYVIKHENGFYRYDFCDLKNKKIIEYNGDQYHANPNKYLSEDKPHPFNLELTSKDIWVKDKLKIEAAEKEGFDVLTIWDSEYRCGNKEEIINKCLKFLTIN